MVHRLIPYVPGEQPRLAQLIKLNTNEHPFGPSPKVLDAIRTATDAGLRLYPDPNASELRAALARHHRLDSEQVFLGNGSDEVLAHAFMALFKRPGGVWFPDISYSFYPVYCGLYDIEYRRVPLTKDFSIHIGDYRPQAGQSAGAIVFPNPNAPTGILLPLHDIERLLTDNPQAVVLVDEAYIDFGGQSAVGLIGKFPNLLITRSFSKSRSLAGLRVGYALGSAELIEGLERVKNSFNSYPLDRLAQAGALASVDDDQYFQESCARVIALRTQLESDLRRLGFLVLPSSANFLFATHPRHSAAQLSLALRQQAIIVRHFTQPERISNFVRITVGTEQQNSALVQALQKLGSDPN